MEWEPVCSECLQGVVVELGVCRFNLQAAGCSGWNPLYWLSAGRLYVGVVVFRKVSELTVSELYVPTRT